MAADSNPDQSRLRCHHCAGPLSMQMETSEWTVAPFTRDSFSMIGSAVGGTTKCILRIQPCDASCPEMGKRTHVVAFPSGAAPALAQLSSSSYHAAVSSQTLSHPASQDDKMLKSRTSSTL